MSKAKGPGANAPGPSTVWVSSARAETRRGHPRARGHHPLGGAGLPVDPQSGDVPAGRIDGVFPSALGRVLTFGRVDQPIDAAESELTEERRKTFIKRLINALSDFDHRVYQGVLLEATHVIPAETEEDCYRWRNLRLAEKGFLPFDEAIGIYQPVKPQDLARLDLVDCDQCDACEAGEQYYPAQPHSSCR